MPFHTTAKSAQNLESEVHNMDIFSRMLTENGLKWRKKSEKPLSDFLTRETGKEVNINITLGEMFKKENEVIDNNADSLDTKNALRETNDDNSGGDRNE